MAKANLKRKKLHPKTVLHIVTGSIAAYKAADLIQALREEGARVLCVMTESAKHFVTPLVLRAVSGERVYHEFFSPDSPYPVVHTSLAEEADLILIAPASADFIARLAAGLADDLASCVILAAKCPVVIVPAMNDGMYENPITQENIRKLRRVGYHFIDPVKGYLVCGKEAVGHISENSTIVDTLSEILGKTKSVRT